MAQAHAANRLPRRALRTVAVIGAGNGGKAAAADLALQGLQVRLFEWAEYYANVEALLKRPLIEAEGVVQGEAELAAVTTSLAEAVEGAELVLVCLQGLAHARLASELAPLLCEDTTVMLNPGSTGGALELRRIWTECGVGAGVTLCETGTLFHCARAMGERGVHIGLRVGHIAFAALPGSLTSTLTEALRPLFPGLMPRRDVLEVALCNGNPVIHPAIFLGNLGAIESRGAEHRFYAEGVTPAVARVIEAVDRERLALGKALGYELLAEPQMCMAQGYGYSDDYYECYAQSPVFAPLSSPPGVEHRYLHEDVGLGLVTYVGLGEMLGVETPVARGLIAMASAVTGHDYLREGRRSPERLGLAGLDEEGRKALLG